MPKNKKEYRKLSRTQLRQLYAYTHKLKVDEEELQAEAATRQDRVKALLDRTGSWGYLYTISHIRLLGAFLVITGMDEEIAAAAQAEDPQAEILSKIEKEWEPERELCEEEEALAIAVVLAVIGNINAVFMFGSTVSDMVEQISAGNEEALLKAVSVDRAAVQAEPIAQRICRAQISGDEAFFQQLAKAITRTKPRRPDKKFDDVRYILSVLDEVIGLNNLSHQSIADLVMHDMQLYPDDTKDPEAGLNKLVQKMRKISRN